MTLPTAEYDHRYLGGILFFNQHDFFEAHEVWESLWMDCGGQERRFYQALIQAAVALYHFSNGNWRGASKLFHSSRKYMESYENGYLGLDIAAFWKHMTACFTEILGPGEPNPAARPTDETIPVITLDPPPVAWPDLAQFEEEDED